MLVGPVTGKRYRVGLNSWTDSGGWNYKCFGAYGSVDSHVWLEQNGK